MSFQLPPVTHAGIGDNQTAGVLVVKGQPACVYASLIGSDPVLKLSWNAIPALFGRAERHTGTSVDARGGTLG